MTRLVLVRHGQATARWDAHPDPGLDDVGRAQAEAMADALAPMGPLPVVTSPLRRTRETAAALERRWGVTAVVDPAVAEVAAPTDDLDARGDWLREVMSQPWAEVPELGPWRRGVLEALVSYERDTVVVTHYVAINVAVGHATGDERFICCQPDNCSWTVLDNDGGTLRVVALGEQAPTRVL